MFEENDVSSNFNFKFCIFFLIHKLSYFISIHIFLSFLLSFSFALYLGPLSLPLPRFIPHLTRDLYG